MPLPTPRSGETENDFVSRCMGDETMKKEFDDQKQRAAVCYSQYKQKKESKMYDFRDLVESTQSIIGEKVGEYKIYHNSYTEAINEIVDHVERNGFTVSDDDMFHIVGTGPRKPSSGKTNFIEIPLYKNNRESNRKIIAQVYNTGSKFELNMYFGQAKPSDFREEVESITEAKSSEIKKWFAAKGVSGKVRTIGTKYIEFRVPAAQTIPNEIRLQVIDTVMPDANVLNRNNVNYGNVKDIYITLSPAQWDKVLSLKEGWGDETFFVQTRGSSKQKMFINKKRAIEYAKKVGGIVVKPSASRSSNFGRSAQMDVVWEP